jgi:DNA-binding CsgD family transcriptional regulator
MPLDKSDHFILDLYRSAQHCSLPLFSEYAFQQLKKHVHFDSAGIADCSIGPANRILMQTVQLHSTTLERFHERTDVVGSEALAANGAVNSRDVLMQAAFLNRGRSAIVDIASTFSDPVVLDYCRRYDTAHALAFIDGNVTASEFCGVSLWRADKRRPFTPTEGKTASRLLSHMILARKMNQRVHAQAEPASSVNVRCNADGQLYLVNQRAIELLRLEWTEWGSPLLPKQLMLSLRQSRENAYHGDAITVRAKMDGEILNLAITQNTPPAGLTSAEWRVAVLAMEGRRYKEIGRELGISPATVRNQLHAIYRKLNVSNKTAIAAALAPVPAAHGTNVP